MIKLVCLLMLQGCAFRPLWGQDAAPIGQHLQSLKSQDQKQRFRSADSLARLADPSGEVIDSLVSAAEAELQRTLHPPPLRKDIFLLEYSNPEKPKGWIPRVRKLGANGKVAILAVVAPDDDKETDPQGNLTDAKAGDERKVADIKLCWCPPGKFMMGSPHSEPDRRSDEGPVEVTLKKGFWMGKYEVTQGQWKKVIGEFVEKQPMDEGDDFPLVWVNYREAEEFCRKLTELGHASADLPNDWEFRLPTEAQWEYACRSGTKTATSFGDKLSSKQANFAGKNPYNGAEAGPSLNRATSVGRYPANPWGLHDMHGNVFEWCRDWYHEKLPGGNDPELSGQKGTVNRDGTYSRARRGGAWGDEGKFCRSALRLRYEPERRSDHIGFRVVAIQP